MKKSILILLLLLCIVQKNYAQTFIETQKIVLSDRELSNRFGEFVEMYGNYAILGNDEQFGIYERIDNVWVLQKSGSFQFEFIYSVSISENYAVVGLRASAHIYKKDEVGNWTIMQEITASDDPFMTSAFGSGTAINNDRIIVGASYASTNTTSCGAVYIFENNNDFWEQKQRLVVENRDPHKDFGRTIDMSDEVIIVGTSVETKNANNEDSLYRAGAAYIFEKDIGGIWSYSQKIVSSDRAKLNFFGSDVAIHNHELIIGAPNNMYDSLGNDSTFAAGASYLFSKNIEGEWVETQKLVASDRESYAQFGWSVAINEQHLVVGAWSATFDGVDNAGAAYVFRKNNGYWSESQKLGAQDQEGGDFFGNRIAITNSSILIGAIEEDFDDSPGNDDDAGAVYAFELCYSTDTTLQVTACNDYLAPNGLSYTQSEVFNITIPNQAGCDSVITIDLTILPQSSSVIFVNTCDSYMAPDSSIHTASKVFDITLLNQYGCDSTITIDLTIPVNDTSVTLNGQTITSNEQDATYRWLDCNSDFSVIPNETNVSFAAIENGNYAVEITNELGCVDTSTCITINTVQLIDIPLLEQVLIYPNPSHNKFYIDLGDLSLASLKLFDPVGKLIFEVQETTDNIYPVEITGQAGLYLLEIVSNNGYRKTYKLSKK